MVLVPAGEFLLGNKPLEQPPQFLSEQTAGLNSQPMQTIQLAGYYIDRYEVTYENFIRFKPRARYPEGKAGEPVRGVSWYEADAYCLWSGKRLPTEYEWEKAARGADGRLYSWGNEFHREYANLGKNVAPVGSFKIDRSPYGVFDMTGNVSEWVADFYRPYPNSKFVDQNFGDKYKVVRGGAISKKEHGFMKEFSMVSYRAYAPPESRTWDTGFRCAANP